jgi:sulfide:quinone oxidoreductase
MDRVGCVHTAHVGADLDPGATPGLVEAGHEFYTTAGAFALRDVLSNAADRIISAIRGGPGASEYDGYGMCYLEFGHDEVARVEVRFVSGQAPTGSYDAPSEMLAADKAAFGTSRICRWFGREWTGVPGPGQ